MKHNTKQLYHSTQSELQHNVFFLQKYSLNFEEVGIWATIWRFEFAEAAADALKSVV